MLDTVESDLNTTKGILQETHGELDALKQYEKRLQEQVVSWEKKYFQLYEKWQSSEEKNFELRNLEDKYQQLQALLANLGNMVKCSRKGEGHIVSEIPEKHPHGENDKNFYTPQSESPPSKPTLFD